MKRLFYAGIALCVFGAIVWLAFDIEQSIDTRKSVADRIHPLPQVYVTALDGERIALAGPERRGTVIVFFRTTCPYCHDEIEDLVANRPLFDDTRVWLISGEPPHVLVDYERRLGLTPGGPFVMGVDADHHVARHFGIRKIPATFVYSSDGQLLERFEGLVRASVIAGAVEAPTSEV